MDSDKYTDSSWHENSHNDLNKLFVTFLCFKVMITRINLNGYSVGVNVTAV